MSKVKDPKNLNFKKCKIAEQMVASRHPLCQIHLAKALPILRYLPSWLLRKEDDEEHEQTQGDDDDKYKRVETKFKEIHNKEQKDNENDDEAASPFLLKKKTMRNQLIAGIKENLEQA